jgi:hypothetical protein
MVQQISNTNPNKYGGGQGKTYSGKVIQQLHDFLAAVGHLFLLQKGKKSPGRKMENRSISYHGADPKSTAFLLFSDFFE